MKKAVKKEMSKQKRAYIFIAICLLLAVILTVFVVFSGESEYTFMSKNWVNAMYNSNDYSFLVLTGENKSINTGANELFDVKYSLTEDKLILFADAKQELGGDLYLVDKNGSVRISQYVYNSVISDDGRVVAYTRDVNAEGIGDLYRYEKGREELIAEDVFYDRISISKDGKKIGFLANYVDNSNFSGMIYENGNFTNLGKNIVAVAYCDDLVYANVVDFEEELFYFSVIRDGEIKRIGEGSSRAVDVFFNRDYSEVVLESEEGSKLYIRGEYKALLFDAEFAEVLTPIGSTGQTVDSGTFAYINVYGIDSFKNKIIYSPDDVYFVDGEYNSRMLLKKFTGIQLSRDGKSAVMTDSKGVVYTYRLGDEQVERGETLLKYFTFVSTDDLSVMYYVSTDYKLYTVTSDGVVLVADNVLGLSMHGDNIYFIGDYDKNLGGGNLYTLNENGTPTLVLRDAYMLSTRVNSTIVFIKNGDAFDVYMTSDGEFKKVDSIKN